MKDAARLGAYFLATVVLGALIAPPLYWIAQGLIGKGWFPFLSGFDFETYFHRALLITALAFLWPFFRSLGIKRLADLGLTANPPWPRDLLIGLLLAAVPLLCCGAVFIAIHVFSLRPGFLWPVFGRNALAAAGVSLVEEFFFRGLILGLLLRSGGQRMAVFSTSAFFAIVHFLKAPDRTSETVTWLSGFNSIAHSFGQFADPMFVTAAFTTLFLLGWILADARIQTRSLWLPVGLHAGWILANGIFSAMTRRETLALPWLGKNLLVGLAPLGVAALTWILMRVWYGRVRSR